MSKKIPLSQNEMQPTFKSFLERMQNKNKIQSRCRIHSIFIVYSIDIECYINYNCYFYSTPKATSTKLQLNGILDAQNSYESHNNRKLDTNCGIVSLVRKFLIIYEKLYRLMFHNTIHLF